MSAKHATLANRSCSCDWPEALHKVADVPRCPLPNPTHAQLAHIVNDTVLYKSDFEDGERLTTMADTTLTVSRHGEGRTALLRAHEFGLQVAAHRLALPGAGQQRLPGAGHLPRNNVQRLLTGPRVVSRWMCASGTGGCG